MPTISFPWTPPHASLRLVCLICLLLASPTWLPRAYAQDRSADQQVMLAEATRLREQYMTLYQAGRYEQAIPLAEREAQLREKALGPNHPDVAESLNDLAVLYQSQGRYREAEPLYQRALGIREKALGFEHPDVAESLNDLAVLYQSQGRDREAELRSLRALGIWEKALGLEHPDMAASLHNLAMLYQSQGRYREAEPLSLRVLGIWEKTLGPEHPDVAASLDSLAALYRSQGRYREAEPLYQRALGIREKALGFEHPAVAGSLNNLAGLYTLYGRYREAEPLYQQSLGIWEKALGPEHPNVATSLANLARLHESQGRDREAEPLHLRALGIREKALGSEHPAVAGSLNNLAALYESQGRYKEAEPLHLRALGIWEKARGPEHPDVANSLNNLALLYTSQSKYNEAESFYQRALRIHEKVLGSQHPNMATNLNNLAGVYRLQGRYREAELLSLRALGIWEKALGPKHPNVATNLNNLAALYCDMGEYAKALPQFERALSIESRYLGQSLHGSEYQRHRHIASFSNEARMRISFHLSNMPADLRAARLAVESIFLYKGQVLESMVDVMHAAHLDADPDGRAMLQDLRDAHAALSHLYLQGFGDTQVTQERYRRRRVALERRLDTLEEALSARSEPSRRLREPVTVAALQARLPRDAALIEFFVYEPYDAKATGLARVNRWGEPRYAAYVIRPHGPVLGVDLGPVAAIDQAVALLRNYFAQHLADVNQHARAVHALVMQPLQAHLGDIRRVYLAPAGQLSFVPFAALVDEHGQYLVEHYSFSYRASGRDLAQSRSATDARAADRHADTIVANPSFNLLAPVPIASTELANASRSRDYEHIGVATALDGTAREAEMLRTLLPGSTLWTQAAATESAVKRVHGPRILHLATHGFFLADQDLERAVMADLSAAELPLQGGAFGGLGLSGPRVPLENALLRSGLLLAGANQHQDSAGDNDGHLTALEVSAMDLAGTQLVVLSACDTGIGAHGASQALYGLRRAFVLAGAETLVMSLWKVDDNATQDLMIRYYRYLLAGDGRAEAMRRVQLEFLREGDRAHPFYWASFVVSGDDSTMAGQPAKLMPMPRGGCAGCQAENSNPSLWLCVLVLLAVSRRRECHQNR